MIPLEVLTASRITTDGGSPSLRLLNPDAVLSPFQPKETEMEPKPHFRVDLENGTISRDDTDLPRLKSDHFLELLRRFSDQKNPPAIEELEALAQEHRLMYDRYSIMTHLSNLRRRLGGGPELITAEKRESGTFFIFNGTVEVVGQTLPPQIKSEEDVKLSPGIAVGIGTTNAFQDTKDSTLPRTERKELEAQILARTPDKIREKLSSALQGFARYYLTPYLYVPFTRDSAISRNEWGGKINHDNPHNGTSTLSSMIAVTEPGLKSAGLELVHIKRPPQKGERGVRASYYLREIIVSTPEETMRRILERGPIALTALASELNPDAEPVIAAQRTVAVLKRLNKLVIQEGLVIPVSGITLLGIMKPEREKAAIQTFEEKKKPQKGIRETNSGEDVTKPDAAIDKNSPQIIVDQKRRMVFINGQIIKYKEGQQTWETFLVFLNNPGAYLSNKEINQAVFERTGQELYNGISALTNAIDERITRSERVSIFKRNGEGTALSAIVSFLLPGREFPKDDAENETGLDNANTDILPDDSEEILIKEIRRKERLKSSNNLRVISNPIQNSFELFDVKLVTPRKKQTHQIRLNTNELTLLEEIVKKAIPPTVDVLANAVMREYYTVFDEKGGFEMVLMSLDGKIHAWGIALEIEEDAGEEGGDVIRVVKYTPEHELSIEPINAAAYDEAAQKDAGPRQRRRKPSHGKLKL